MYIYHALINALSAHMIHINLNMIFYTHVKHSPTKTIYTHTHTHTLTVAETGYWWKYCEKRKLGWKYCEKRKVFSLALKDDRVEQCLKSCGSEFQMCIYFAFLFLQIWLGWGIIFFCFGSVRSLHIKNCVPLFVELVHLVFRRWNTYMTVFNSLPFG